MWKSSSHMLNVNCLFRFQQQAFLLAVGGGPFQAPRSTHPLGYLYRRPHGRVRQRSKEEAADGPAPWVESGVTVPAGRRLHQPSFFGSTHEHGSPPPREHKSYAFLPSRTPTRSSSWGPRSGPNLWSSPFRIPGRVRMTSGGTGVHWIAGQVLTRGFREIREHTYTHFKIYIYVDVGSTKQK